MIKRYSVSRIRIHWIAAIGIMGMIGTGMAMEEALPSAEKVRLLQIHVGLGIGVSLLSGYRLWHHAKEKKQHLIPESPPFDRALITRVRTFVHLALRNMMVGLAITGLLGLYLTGLMEVAISGSEGAYSSFQSSGAHTAHAILSKIYLLLFLIHLVGVFQFTWQKGNLIWYRMGLGRQTSQKTDQVHIT